MNGQEPEKVHKTFKVYKIYVDTMDNLRITGFLEDLDSTGITVANKTPIKATERMMVPAENIKSIKMRRKGSVLKGAGYGLAVGIAAGAMTGSQASDESFFSREASIAIGSIMFGSMGAITGAIIGSASKKMVIHGKVAMYHLKIPVIEEMVYGKVRASE